MHDLSRRSLFRSLAGASVLELAHYRAAWARAMAPQSDTTLFDIEKIAPGAYFARARPQAMTNCNAAIFENAADVLVVDAHSKPSAAAALIAQIKREITPKPVRYVVNTHFHWDHTQGNHAYRAAEKKIDFIASEPTKKLMADLAGQRLLASLAAVPQQIDALQARAGKSRSPAEKTWCEIFKSSRGSSIAAVRSRFFPTRSSWQPTTRFLCRPRTSTSRFARSVPRGSRREGPPRFQPGSFTTS